MNTVARSAQAKRPVNLSVREDLIREARAQGIKLSQVLERALERELREACLLYTSPSPRDRTRSRMPSSA